MYVSLYSGGSQGQGNNETGGPIREPIPFWTIFGCSGHELMHPEAYMERLASTKQVSALKNIIRGQFSSILLTSVSANV